MQTLSIREIRAAMGQLDQLVNASGELIITKNGKPIARISPFHRRKKRPSHDELRALMPIASTDSTQLIREDRDER